MKFKRLISGAAAVALAVSALSISASADLSKKPGEVGFMTSQERQYTDDYNFLAKPYSLTSGDYYMGISFQSPNWNFREFIGKPDVAGENMMTKSGVKVTGINPYCPWARLYIHGYAQFVSDKDGNEFRAKSSDAIGPGGIFYDEATEGIPGIKEYSVLHDAKIEDSGTYTIGIQGFNFKKNVSADGNGLNWLAITSNIKYMESNGVTIKNPVLKFYNTKEEYASKKPYKSMTAGYWLTSPFEAQKKDKYQAYKDYTEYKFVNIYTNNNSKCTELGDKIVKFDNKYQDNEKHLDAFGLSPYSGAKSSESECTKNG